MQESLIIWGDKDQIFDISMASELKEYVTYTMPRNIRLKFANFSVRPAVGSVLFAILEIHLSKVRLTIESHPVQDKTKIR